VHELCLSAAREYVVRRTQIRLTASLQTTGQDTAYDGFQPLYPIEPSWGTTPLSQ
jgi:hypothetical protein